MQRSMNKTYIAHEANLLYGDLFNSRCASLSEMHLKSLKLFFICEQNRMNSLVAHSYFWSK